jgi:hypothetical protein
MFPKPIKLTEKEKYEKKLAKLKEMKQRQIDRLREGKKRQVSKAKEPRLSELKKILQKKVNAYIRQRDAGQPCISCGRDCGPAQCGHYIAQGSSGALRYNFDNLNLQGAGCNLYKHGNLIDYRIGLVKKIGLKRVEYLEEHRHDIKKWTREELKLIEESLK